VKTTLYNQLAEASPFWAGAFAACAEQGFDAQGTRELLEKCAQADPILAEEYATLVKSAVDPDAPSAMSSLAGGSSPRRNLGLESPALAGLKAIPSGLWEGVSNSSRAVSNLARALGGGLGTALTGLTAFVEGGAKKLVGSDSPNVSAKALDSVADLTRTGVADLGATLGFQGLEGLPSQQPNQFDIKYDQLLDRSTLPSAVKDISRGSKYTAELAAQTLALIATPGAVVKTTLKGPAAGMNFLRSGAELGGLTGTRALAKKLWKPRSVKLVGGATAGTGVTNAVNTGIKAWREPWLPPDVRTVLGDRANATEAQLRKSVVNYVTNMVPNILNKGSVNEFDHQVSVAAFDFAKKQVLYEFQQAYLGPTAAPSTVATAAKDGLLATLAHNTEQMGEPSIWNSIKGVRPTIKDVYSSDLAHQGMQISRAATPRSFPEAGGMAARTGGVAVDRVAPHWIQELLDAYSQNQNKK